MTKRSGATPAGGPDDDAHHRVPELVADIFDQLEAGIVRFHDDVDQRDRDVAMFRELLAGGVGGSGGKDLERPPGKGEALEESWLMEMTSGSSSTTRSFHVRGWGRGSGSPAFFSPVSLLALLVSRVARDVDLEAYASAGAACAMDVAAQFVGDDVVAEEHAEPGAAGAATGREEGLEDPLGDLGAHAGTVVGVAQAHRRRGWLRDSMRTLPARVPSAKPCCRLFIRRLTRSCSKRPGMPLTRSASGQFYGDGDRPRRNWPLSEDRVLDDLADVEDPPFLRRLVDRGALEALHHGRGPFQV